MQNRVIKIRESVKPSLWNYCNTKENPADIITRFRPHDLSSNSLWWEVPFFLKDINEETLCTKENLEIETQKNDAEFITEFGREIINKSTTLVSISKEIFGTGNIINIEHFSDLIKLFRLSAWVLRFVTNLKKKHSGRKLNLNRFISTSEIRFVKLLWIQENQAVISGKKMILYYYTKNNPHKNSSWLRLLTLCQVKVDKHVEQEYYLESPETL